MKTQPLSFVSVRSVSEEQHRCEAADLGCRWNLG